MEKVQVVFMAELLFLLIVLCEISLVMFLVPLLQIIFETFG